MMNSATTQMRGRRWCSLSGLIALFVTLLAVAPSAAAAGDTHADILKIDGPIGPVTKMLVENAIERAEGNGAAVLIIELDTPGGLVSTTKEITQDILNANVPVAVYVSPVGASATSAGVFIVTSAHFAVMAPGTNIGAAHPVMLEGQMDSTMSHKAENDAAANIRAMAERRGRNADWVERAVRKSESITAAQAVDSNVVDFIAEDVEALLDSLDGRMVMLPRGEDTLHTAGASTEMYEMSWREKLLGIITDPNIAYILMSIGWLGIMMELYNPGAILPGVVGTISLVLGFYALQTLPIDYAGLALIGLAIIMFILELKIVSHGLLGLGGTISLLIGSLMLIDSPDPAMNISLSVILAVVATTAAFFALAFFLVVKARRSQPTTGSEGMIGQKGTARAAFENGTGMVYVAGEYWSARSDMPIDAEAKIEVIGKDGMVLIVKSLS